MSDYQCGQAAGIGAMALLAVTLTAATTLALIRLAGLITTR